MTEILSYLRHTNPEVKKQALAAVFQYSEHPEVVEFIRKSEMMKAIKACLYDLVSIHFLSRGSLLLPYHRELTYLENGALHSTSIAQFERRQGHSN